MIMINITTRRVLMAMWSMVFLAPITGSADEAMLEKGKQVAEDRRKGNCLACHMMGNGELPGNQGPPLVSMQLRFPDKEDLRAQIYNPLEKNPNSLMPPFGLHNIVSDEELDAIVEYVYSL